MLPLVIAGALSGCVPWTLLPHAKPGARPLPSASGGASVCTDGQSLEIDGSGIRRAISGECGRITVRGNDIVLSIASAKELEIDGQSVRATTGHGLASIVVRGNDNRIRASAMGSVSVQGNGNHLIAVTVGSLTLRGDHNVMASDRTPSSVSQTGEGTN
jgi:hypothetical protein